MNAEKTLVVLNNENCNKKITIQLKYTWLIIAVLFLEHTYYSRFLLSPLMIYGIYAILLVYLYQIEKKQFSLRSVVFQSILLAIIVSNLTISFLVSRDQSNYTINRILFICVAFLFAVRADKKIFARAFISAMVFLGITSLVLTYTCIGFSSFFVNNFPVFEISSNGGMRFVNLGICFVYIPYYGVQFRNFSVFSEPGVFQIYLNIALLLRLFILSKDKMFLRDIVILFLTLLSTFSTMGIVIGVSSLILFLFASDKGTRNKIKIRLVCLAIICVILGAFFFKEEMLAIFDKLKGGGSFNSRYYSLLVVLKAFFEKPLLGWGYDKLISIVVGEWLSLYTEDLTNTFFTIFATYGVVFGSISLIGFFANFYDRRKWVISLLVCGLIFLSTCNENMTDSLLLYIMIFWGGNLRNSKHESLYLT